MIWQIVLTGIIGAVAGNVLGYIMYAPPTKLPPRKDFDYPTTYVMHPYDMNGKEYKNINYCYRCGEHARVHNQKFCHNCGSKLLWDWRKK